MVRGIRISYQFLCVSSPTTCALSKHLFFLLIWEGEKRKLPLLKVALGWATFSLFLVLKWVEEFRDCELQESQSSFSFSLRDMVAWGSTYGGLLRA